MENRPDKPFFFQKDTKVLREALAHCANYGTPIIRERAMSALSRFAFLVQHYCQHVDLASLNGQKKCIDCGKGFYSDSEPSKL